MISIRNILYHELIGLDVSVVHADNGAQCSIKGLVVFETRNMLHIKTKKGIMKIQKKGTTFAFTLPDGTCVAVFGTLIALPPERRTSMRVKI